MRRPGGIALLYIAAYIAFDWVSFIHPIEQLAITPWNPPPGLSLFLLVRFGLGYTPLLFVAAIVADLAVRGVPLHPLHTIASSSLLATGYALAGMLLVRQLGVRGVLRSLRDVNRFVAVGTLAPLAVAIAYVGLHVAIDELAVADMTRAILQFWIGDAIGIVVTTPLLLELAQRPPALPRRIRLEPLLQGFTILLALWVVFGMRATDEFKFFYLLFLPPIWIAMRHGLRGAVLSTLVIQLGLIAAGDRIAAKGIALFELQFLMLTLALATLYLGMAVSERARAQQAMAARDATLHRVLRMATAGELAAAIAHELNQPLSAIGTYARASIAMLDQPSNAGRVRETLDKLAREVGRAGEVIRRLRDFYRSGSARRERIAPGTLMAAALQSMTDRTTQASIAVQVSYAPRLPEIEVDTVQMQAVLHNLLANAVDALQDVPETSRRIAVSVGARDGRMVAFVVADSGPGIAPERADRLFEPFATTKPQGMGLGLAMSRSIVEAHGGKLTSIPSPLGGAAFEVQLPMVEELA